MTNLLTLDRAIGDRAAHWRERPAVRIAGAASDVADQLQLLAVCAGTAVAGAALRRPRLVRTGVEMVAAMGVATLLKKLVKDRVDRSRPYVVADGGAYVFAPGRHDMTELDAFPSGHTADAAAVARVIARRHPALGGAAAAATVVIALVQLPRGKHYPSDLLAGAIVGLAADAAVALAARRLRRAA